MPSVSRCLLALSLLALAACAPSPARDPTLADMEIVSQDERYALVRLKRNQDFTDLAHVFLGHRYEDWQIREVNADHRARPGQIVAVPLRPVNPSSVYTDGYRTLPILCYHQFSAGRATHQLELSAADFEAQLVYLKRNRYRTLSFAEVEDIMLRGQPIPERAVVITIDDGYRSVYDVAWPLLQKHGVKATLFNYTDFIGAPAAMTWRKMREMVDSGLVEVESHGKSHSSLSRLPTDDSQSAYLARLREEIRGANRAFARHLGRTPRFLSYPYGNSSTDASRVAREEGIVLAATVTRGRNATFAYPFLLHRTMIYDDHDLDDFKAMLQGFSRRRLQ